MQSPRHRTRLWIATATALLLAAAGCSTLPTAPELSSTPSQPGAAPATLSLSDDASGGGTTLAQPLTVKKTIGLLGGTLSVGHFTLVVPAGALTNRATISMSVPAADSPQCQLEIDPPSANGFLLPVTLIADANGIPQVVNPLKLSIAWWNPDKQQYEQVDGAAVNVLDLTVVAPLYHFSQYSVTDDGKAGW